MDSVKDNLRGRGVDTEETTNRAHEEKRGKQKRHNINQEKKIK